MNAAGKHTEVKKTPGYMISSAISNNYRKNQGTIRLQPLKGRTSMKVLWKWSFISMVDE